MSNLESDNKERLSNSEFCELIPHLKLNDLLLIEYRIADKWGRLFKVSNPTATTKAYHCNLCGVSQSGLKNLVAHIDGKKHKVQMKSVKQLFHHEYTYLKTEANMAEGSTSEDTDGTPATQNIISSKATPDILDFTITYENYEPKITDTIANMRKANTIESNMTEKQDDSDHDIGLTKAVAPEQPIKSTSTQIICMKKQENPSQNSLKPTDVREHSVDTTKNISTQNEPKKAENVVNQPHNKNHIIKTKYQWKNTINNNSSKEKSNQLVDSTKNKTETSKPLTTLVNTTRKTSRLKTPTKVVNPATTLKKTGITSEVRQVESHGGSSYAANIIITPSKYKKIVGNAPAPSNDQPRFTTKSWDLDIHDEQLHALLGAEYVIKIMKYKDDKSPKYECSLCELILEGRAMQNHLIGYNHRLKYCEKHFPTAVHQFRQSIDNVPVHEEFKVLGPILAKLAQAVEDHHGRELPFESMERDFNQNRHKNFLEVFSRRHASEHNGPSFTNVVNAKEIDQFILNRHTYKPPLVYMGPSTDTKVAAKLHSQNSAPVGLSAEINFNLNRVRPVSFAPINPPIFPANNPYIPMAPQPVYQTFPAYPPVDTIPQVPKFGAYADTQVDDETHRLMVEKFLETNKKHSSSSHRPNNESRQSHLKRTNNREHVSSRSPDRKRQRSHSQLDSRSEHKLAEIERLFRGYRENPETHPMYNEEWQKFWNHRKNELIAAGLDHRTHNYQPEWVNFLKVRIEQLYQEAVDNIRGQSQAKQSINRETSNRDIPDPFNLPRKNTVLAPAPVENSLESRDEVSYASKSTVVSVLRFLTALEEHLGSLGPKIIELLSQALQAEKNCPEKINAIMLTIENCALLETAKEKFKGLVIAEFLEPTKERVLKKAIKEVESLLQIAEKERKTNPCKIEKPVLNTSNLQRANVEPVYELPAKQQVVQYPQNQNVSANRPIQKQTPAPNPAISNFLAQADKKELALKLAAAISAQGKTDCDPDQLQQLLAVYALMEKKKREAAQAQNPNVIADKPAKKTQKTLSDTLIDYLNPSAATSQAERPNYGSHANEPERLLVANNSNQNLVAQSSESSMWQNLQNIFKNSQNGTPRDYNPHKNNPNFQNVGLSNPHTFNPNPSIHTLRGKESGALTSRVEQNVQNFNQRITPKESSNRSNFSANASMNTFSSNERYSYNASNNSRMISANNTFNQMEAQRTVNNIRSSYASQQQQNTQLTYQQGPYFQTQQQQSNLGQNQLWNTENPSRNNSFTGNQQRNNANDYGSNFQSFRGGNMGRQY